MKIVLVTLFAIEIAMACLLAFLLSVVVLKKNNEALECMIK